VFIDITDTAGMLWRHWPGEVDLTHSPGWRWWRL